MTNNNITAVLVGNPNAGKTALFNALTGLCQKVGNWPGVTVERKAGHFFHQKQSVTVIDLPGTYALHLAAGSANAIDQQIACRYLSEQQPDVVVNVIDAGNLERHLYLTLQLLEMGLPVVVAVNMMDTLPGLGIRLNLDQLSQRLGCPVLPIVANRAHGIMDLRTAITQYQPNEQVLTALDVQADLPKPIQAASESIQQYLMDQKIVQNNTQAAHYSLRLLENDALINKQLSSEQRAFVVDEQEHITKQLDETADIFLADNRYKLANQLVSDVSEQITKRRHGISQWIDKLVLNRYLGIPIFLAVMYLMFMFAVGVSGAFQDFFDISSSTVLVSGTAHLLEQWHAPAWLIALLANGVGKGINTTLTFIPVIGGMFLFLSFLEDSGYMARAAFVMDRAMRAIGLPGKSFVPMIVGFGCNVPAVMGARTLANPRDRILTVLMMPFMSCGARLAIFAVFVTAFFPTGGQDIVFLLYIIGILVAVLTGLLVRKTVLPGQSAPLVMEMPPYRWPRLRDLMRHAWQRLKRFVVRAGKMIVPVCVLIGALNSISVDGRLMAPNTKQQSLLAMVGKKVTPVLAPMGIHRENWPATVGLVTGVLAKEVVIGSLNSLYSRAGHLTQQAGEQFDFWGGLKAAALTVPANLSGLGAAFQNPFIANEAPHDMSQKVYGLMYHRFGGQAAAFAYLLFVLLYFPCISTLAAMRREVGRRWAYFSMGWSTVLAYSLAVGTYQAWTVTAHPMSSISWLLGLGLLMGSIIWMMKRYVRAEGTQLRMGMNDAVGC